MALLAGLAGQVPKLKFNGLSTAWEKLGKVPNLQKSDGAFNEKYELRFGIVATLLQAVYVGKMMYDDNPDPKVQAELTIAQFTLTAGAVDLLATAMKGGAGEGSLAFQALKVSGGLFSATAAGLTVWKGWSDVADTFEKDRFALASLYTLKVLTDLTAGLLSFFVTLSYAKPAFDSLKARYPNALIARASHFISWTLKRRATLMMWGLRLNMASLVISSVISLYGWILSENAMTKWCSHNAFTKGGGKKYAEAQTQIDDFKSALAEAL
jgi:hypothetical protein